LYQLRSKIAGSGEMRQVPLHVHLGFLAVGRRRQRDRAEDARADAFGERADRAALAGRVASLEDDDDAGACVPDPLLQMAELGLELSQLGIVVLALEPFGPLLFLLHDVPPGRAPSS
jgi:hypothetical protein